MQGHCVGYNDGTCVFTIELDNHWFMYIELDMYIGPGLGWPA